MQSPGPGMTFELDLLDLTWTSHGPDLGPDQGPGPKLDNTSGFLTSVSLG